MAFIGRLITGTLAVQVFARMWLKVLLLGFWPLLHAWSGSVNAWTVVTRCVRTVSQYGDDTIRANVDMVELIVNDLMWGIRRFSMRSCSVN